MPKVVSLQVHKNTKEARRRHDTAKLLLMATKEIASKKDVVSFAVFAEHSDGSISEHVFTPEGVDQEYFIYRLGLQMAEAGIEEEEEPEASN